MRGRESERGGGRDVVRKGGTEGGTEGERRVGERGETHGREGC